MKCFYHSVDLDGHCSGAIVKHKYPETEMFPINYGDSFPWEAILPGEEVFMVDFCLQPFEDMERLAGMCKLIWIDHHKTAIDESAVRNFTPWACYPQVGRGACELAWEYLFPECKIPLAVELLGRYDVWDHSNPNCLPFQYRMRMEETDPRFSMKTVWEELFDETEGRVAVAGMCLDGELLLKYEEQQNTKFCRAYAFETVLDLADRTEDGELIYKPHHAICANRGFTNSKVFDSVFDPDRHDLMITFCRLPKHKQAKGGWTVSLYSTKSEVDCGAIAKIFGGGGHRGAAGFQCKQLPFQY